jgi:hypothetical protein
MYKTQQFEMTRAQIASVDLEKHHLSKMLEKVQKTHKSAVDGLTASKIELEKFLISVCTR